MRMGLFTLLILGLLGALPLMGYDTLQARAAAFSFIAIAQLLEVYPARHTWAFPLANPYLHAAAQALWRQTQDGGSAEQRAAVVEAALGEIQTHVLLQTRARAGPWTLCSRKA